MDAPLQVKSKLADWPHRAMATESDFRDVAKCVLAMCYTKASMKDTSRARTAQMTGRGIKNKTLEKEDQNSWADILRELPGASLEHY